MPIHAERPRATGTGATSGGRPASGVARPGWFAAVLVALLVLPSDPLRAALTNGTSIIPVIDVHTHIFNARDLPVEGILSARGIPQPVAGIAATWLVGRTPDEPLDAPLTLAAYGFGKDNANFKAEAVRPRPLPKLSKRDRQQLLEYAGEPDTTNSLISTEKLLAPPMDPDLTPEDRAVIQVLRRAGIPPAEDAVFTPPPAAKFALEPKAAAAGSGGYLDFFRIMTSGSLAIPRQLREQEYPAVDLFVHHMMDLARAYDNKPKVDFADQLKRMTLIDRRFDGQTNRGQFLHFVAWDPFRRERALTLVTQGIAAGAIGVKFYPPSGYRAAGNSLPPRPEGGGLFGRTGDQKRWDSRYRGLTSAGLDDLNRSLFAWCTNHDIPVFTHCTPHGFEAVGGTNGYGWMSDPKYWARTLLEFPTLRLCFGHSGGEAYWFPDAPGKPDEFEAVRRSFGTNVVQLCLTYPNVYCEVAYLDPILQPDSAARFTQRLAPVLGLRSADGAWSFGDRFMYGTDWHMLHQVKGHQRYLEVFAGIFSQPGFAEYRRRFFAGNAVRFLKLGSRTNDPALSDALRKRLTWIVDQSSAP